MVFTIKSILNKSCNVLNFISGEKKQAAPNVVQNRQPYRTQTLIAIPGSTVSIFGKNEKYNICTFNQEIQYLKADVFGNIIKSYSSF